VRNPLGHHGLQAYASIDWGESAGARPWRNLPAVLTVEAQALQDPLRAEPFL